ncbi:MAG: cation:proton antiporter [Thermoguttaceae bacterium]|nr:cation:proton antiporter [Thermoguttaceae bacterium]
MIEVALALSAAMVSIAVVMSFLRLVWGPSLPDRVVALDLIAIEVVAAVAIYEIATEQPVLLDAAIVLAMVAFLGTVAFARYVERGGHHD